MNFEDATLLQLANSATRRAVFDDLALEHIIDAAFVATTLGVQGPFDATFDEIRFGMFTPATARVDGGWSALGGADRTETRIDVTWPDHGSAPHADAVWRGSVIAQAAVATSRVDAVSSTWPAEDAGDGITVPVAEPGQVVGRVKVSFSDPGQPQSVPRSFPVAVALLIRGTGEGLADLLAQSKAIQWLLASSMERPRDADLPARHPVVVGWVLPSTVFDDPGWPGGDAGLPQAAARLARRADAAQWLALEGVALVVVDPPA